ncbi:MAG: aminodeoxychorismate synthase component I [Candidatus Omnitrophota bacterium]
MKRNKQFSSFPLEQIRSNFLNKESFILLENQRVDRENHLSYLFSEPVALITCFDLGAVYKSFAQLEKFLKEGYWSAGFFSYEMGYGFEDFRIKRKFSFPLIWLGIFRQPLIFDHLRGEFLNQSPGLDRKTLPVYQRPCCGDKYKIRDIRFNEDEPGYLRNIARIKNLITQGATYQVNYTFKCKFKFQGSSLALYKNLRDTQPVAYSAFIKSRRFTLFSFSPELFFRKEGRLITVRPMKGTISRGRNEEEDKSQIKRLKASRKDRSENIMIVDLLRNDLGRISEINSVKVDKIYTVEKYKTLFQMTSTIQSRLKENLALYDIFKSIFPSGSVTGAPKIETMGIIKRLEREKRRIYTGAVGFFKPNKDAVFNVAIRTLLLRKNAGEMGIGSGIVYDSDPHKEYNECKLKAMFFVSLGKGIVKENLFYRQRSSHEKSGFELIETMRWRAGKGFMLLPYHLERLRSSAAYFNFSFNEAMIRERLEKAARVFCGEGNYRVRLLLSDSGEVKINYQRLKAAQSKDGDRITFARRKTDSQDVFLYHKTTNRALYNREYDKAKKAGFFDVIFENEKEEITEGAVSNIFIRKGSMYYTPPIKSGLLNGVYRRYFLQEKAPFVKEKVLRRDDLFQAEAVYLTNAVRGMARVRLS